MDRSLNPRLTRLDVLVGEWERRLEAQPGPDFFQRFDGVLNDDRTVIDGRWEASSDGTNWSTDFDVTYRRMPG